MNNIASNMEASVSTGIETPPHRIRAFLDLLVFFAGLGGLTWLEMSGQLPGELGPIVGIAGTFLLVVLIVKLQGQKLLSLGLGRPRRLTTLPLWTIAILGGSIAIANGSEWLVAQFIDMPPQDLSRFDVLVGNLPMLLAGLASVWVTAAFFEEIVYRGFVLGRLMDFLGNERTRVFIAIALHAVLFGLLHAYQGISGILMTGIVGFVYGVFFVLMKRNLWALILAHGLNDTIGFVMIYLGMY